ncbi:L2 [Anas platyrhynchos papillomavirus 2]|nr:L2 [Anas platyrhynchos papillomavirus 2]
MYILPVNLRLKKSIRHRLRRNVKNTREERKRNKKKVPTRNKRASADQLWANCQMGMDCPQDVKDKYTQNTWADKILKWMSPLLFLGGAGIGYGPAGAVANTLARMSGIPRGQTIGAGIRNALNNAVQGSRGYTRLPLGESPTLPRQTVPSDTPTSVTTVINPVYETPDLVHPDLQPSNAAIDGFTSPKGPDGPRLVDIENPVYDSFINQHPDQDNLPPIPGLGDGGDDSIVQGSEHLPTHPRMADVFESVSVVNNTGPDVELNVLSHVSESGFEDATIVGAEYGPQSSTPIGQRVRDMTRRLLGGYKGPWTKAIDPRVMYDEIPMEEIIGGDEAEEFARTATRASEVRTTSKGPQTTVRTERVLYLPGMETRAGTRLDRPEGVYLEMSPILAPSSDVLGTVEPDDLSFGPRGDMGVAVDDVFWDVELQDPAQDVRNSVLSRARQLLTQSGSTARGSGVQPPVSLTISENGVVSWEGPGGSFSGPGAETEQYGPRQPWLPIGPGITPANLYPGVGALVLAGYFDPFLYLQRKRRRLGWDIWITL